MMEFTETKQQKEGPTPPDSPRSRNTHVSLQQEIGKAVSRVERGTGRREEEEEDGRRRRTSMNRGCEIDSSYRSEIEGVFLFFFGSETCV